MKKIIVCCVGLVFLVSGCSWKAPCSECNGSGKVIHERTQDEIIELSKNCILDANGNKVLPGKTVEVMCLKCKGVGEGYKTLFGGFTPITAK